MNSLVTASEEYAGVPVRPASAWSWATIGATSTAATPLTADSMARSSRSAARNRRSISRASTVRSPLRTRSSSVSSSCDSEATAV